MVVGPIEIRNAGPKHSTETLLRIPKNRSSQVGSANFAVLSPNTFAGRNTRFLASRVGRLSWHHNARISHSVNHLVESRLYSPEHI
jgi:hypothetical protein